MLFVVSVKDYEGGDSHSQGYRSDDKQYREITRRIKREVNKLSDKWNELLQQTEQRQKRLDDVQRVSTQTIESLTRHHIPAIIIFYCYKHCFPIELHKRFAHYLYLD